METPSKQPRSSTMTHEEEEEMQHDISKLQDQMQQISLAQKVTEAKMDGLKKGIEAKMNDVEAKMDIVEANMDDLKKGMEDLKTKFLQEMLSNGERIVNETHDENKRNVNHDFIDSNFGLKTHHVPKFGMRKFDGKDPRTWIL